MKRIKEWGVIACFVLAMLAVQGAIALAFAGSVSPITYIAELPPAGLSVYEDYERDVVCYIVRDMRNIPHDRSVSISCVLMPANVENWQPLNVPLAPWE